MTSVAGPQRVLVVGSGGREHALAWTLAREPGVEAVIAAPGNAGMVDVASVHDDVAATDHQGLLRLALESGSDLVVIGPEEPLTEGLADLMARSGMAVFGPSAEAARLEGSKSFCRQLADAAGVPMADGASFDQPAEAIDFVHTIGPPVVVKADGLAAGKGVSICGTATEARAAIHDAMVAGVFGPAGARLVIERVLVG
ncbi:MAG: phosphoribosylamine--glycine ligase, partial [Chloroflexi bacterium]|nr:phosphoribosylamine--glycine ligase [Chloroflexota bacterium]